MTGKNQRALELKNPISFIGKKVPSACWHNHRKKQEKIMSMVLACGVQSAYFNVTCDCGVRGERYVGDDYYFVACGSISKKRGFMGRNVSDKTKKFIKNILQNSPAEQIAKKAIKTWADVDERAHWFVPITEKDVLKMNKEVREKFKR